MKIKNSIRIIAILLFIGIFSNMVSAEICSLFMNTTNSFNNINLGDNPTSHYGGDAEFYIYNVAPYVTVMRLNFSHSNCPDNLGTINNIIITHEGGEPSKTADVYLQTSFDTATHTYNLNTTTGGGTSWNGGEDTKGAYLGTLYIDDTNRVDSVMGTSGLSNFKNQYDGNDKLVWLYFNPNGTINSVIKDNDDGAQAPNISIIYTSDNNPPVITWDNEQEIDGYSINQSEDLIYYFQVTDLDSNPLSCHIKLDSDFKNSSYSIIDAANESLSFNTGNLSQGAHIVSLLCDDGTVNTTETKTLNWDVTSPILNITSMFPRLDNSSVAWNPSNIPLNTTCYDTLSNLWSFQINITNSTGDQIHSYYIEDLNSSIFAYDSTVYGTLDLSNNPNETLNTYMECWDSHTYYKIKDFNPEKHYDVALLEYNTGDNIITVQPTNPSEIIDFNTVKEIDRYTFEYEYNKIKNDLSFIVTSWKPLKYQELSKYAAHFVTGTDWIDFDLKTKKGEETYEIEMLDDYTALVTIRNIKSNKVKFKSVGKLNQKIENAQFRLGNTPPTGLTIIRPDNNTINTNNTIILECNATDSEGDDIYYQYYGDDESTFPPTTLLQNTTSNTYSWIVGDSTYNWYCKACNVDGSCTPDSNIRQFESIVSDIISFNQTSPGTIFETNLAPFNASILYNTYRYSSIDVALILNNTAYPTTETIISDYRYYQSDVIIEGLTDDATWNYNWNINLTYPNGTIVQNNTYADTIDVKYINFTKCFIGSGITNTTYLNVSFKDESTDLDINASISGSILTYWLYNKDQANKIYLFSNNSENPSYPFCFMPENATVYLEAVIQYQANNYPLRTYRETITLTESTTDKTLYLLAAGLGSYVTFQVINTADQTIEDVYVTVKTVLGTLIESKFTDAAGGATFFLDPDEFYTITFQKNGYVTQSITISPSQTAYTITLIQTTTSTLENYAAGINLLLLPSEDVLLNQTNYNFNITSVSSYFELEETGFTLTNSSGTNLGSASCTGSTGCTASTIINTGTNEDILMNYYYIINSTYMNGTKTWNIKPLYIGKGALARIITYIKNLGGTFEDSLEYNFTKALFSLFVVIITTLSLCWISGIFSLDAITGVAFATTFLLDRMDLVPQVGIVDHFIVIVMGILFIGGILQERLR